MITTTSHTYNTCHDVHQSATIIIIIIIIIITTTTTTNIALSLWQKEILPFEYICISFVLILERII
jgi:hypothetical protein